MVSSANAGAANMVAAAANKQIRFIHSSLCAPAPAAANAPPRPVGDSLLALSFLAESAPRIGKKIAQSARESHADSLPQSRLSGRPMSPEAAACGRSIGSPDVHLLRWKPDRKPKLKSGRPLPVIECLHERYVALFRRPDARAAKRRARPAASCPSSSAHAID